MQGKAVDAEKQTMQLVEQVRETQAQLASQVAETEAAKQACQQLQVNSHSLTKGLWLPSCATLWQDTSCARHTRAHSKTSMFASRCFSLCDGCSLLAKLLGVFSGSSGTVFLPCLLKSKLCRALTVR